jgi:rSAM/selenodomain-associated transferase 1
MQIETTHRVLNAGEVHSAASGKCALAVMTKAPYSGKVKTRLVPPLTHDEAAQLNICFLRDTASAISKAVHQGGRGIAVYTPIGAEPAYADILPLDFCLVPQRGEAFGDRLMVAVEDLFQIGFASVCLIDSDSPTVSAKIYAQAVKELARPGDRVVIGPSDDGGYYLIGLKKLHRRMFEGIDWSTEQVLEQTKQRAAELGLETRLLPAGYDVDNQATLQRLCRELLRQEPVSSPSLAPSTTACLRRLVAGGVGERIWMGSGAR